MLRKLRDALAAWRSAERDLAGAAPDVRADREADVSDRHEEYETALVEHQQESAHSGETAAPPDDATQARAE